MTITAVRARVTGRVQGVAFRAWTERRARSLGLTGWVQNEPDGSVSGLFAVEAERVAEMIAALHQGPSLARVQAVTAEVADPAEAPVGFRINR